MSAAVIAHGALSPLGRGDAAFDVSALGEKAVVAIERDEALAALGFARPFCARVDDALLSTRAPDTITSDRATHLLFDATTDVLAELRSVRPGFPSERIGVAIGTSSGGMRSAERWFERRAKGEATTSELARDATYFGPFERILELTELSSARRKTQLVTACAASTWAIGVGLRWLESGEVDVAIVGGYDALGPFVAAGFECIRATSASCPPQPFRIGRDGMALGEGAAVLALVRSDDLRGAVPRFFVTGFGASTDAVHITAPDRTGAGLARAASQAIADAEAVADDVVMVSAHGTATPYNDAMEARAIATAVSGARPVVHPFKAQIGHTLGAAGALETLAIGHALARNVFPAAAGDAPIDPDADVRLLDRAQPLESLRARRLALKESAAFGGANAAVILEAHAPTYRSPAVRRGARLIAAARADAIDVDTIARTSGGAVDRISRFDEISLLAATSVARVLETIAPEDPIRARLRDAGVIVGHGLATIDINERFYARVLSRGPTSAEPRLFPPTSPNVMPGQIAILFGLQGPSAATCGSLGGAREALDLAFDLVRSGDAEVVIAVGVDWVGPTSRALLDSAFPGVELTSGSVAAIVGREGLSEKELPFPAWPPSNDARGQRALAEALGL